MDNYNKKILLSYIAGLFDSDGSFSIIKTKVKIKHKNQWRGRYVAWAQLAQIDNKAIRIVEKIFKGAHYTTITCAGRLFYRVCFWSGKVFNLAKELLPYIYIKKKQVKLLLKYEKFLKIKIKKCSKRIKIKKGKYRSYFRTTYFNSCITYKNQNNFVHQMRKLNGTLKRKI